jgi:ribonuclease Z
MASHLLKAYQQDIRYRVYGRESANDKGWRVNAHEVKEGTIYKDENVTVDAFKVRHGTWPNAFGYRFTTPDRIIVLSGDAALDTNLEKYSQGADILIHEAYSVAGASASAPAWQKYMSDNHTSTHELGELAARLRPDLLLLYHVVFLGSSEEEIVAEVKHTYSGQTILANDLDVF